MLPDDIGQPASRGKVDGVPGRPSSALEQNTKLKIENWLTKWSRLRPHLSHFLEPSRSLFAGCLLVFVWDRLRLRLCYGPSKSIAQRKAVVDSQREAATPSWPPEHFSRGCLHIYPHLRYPRLAYRAVMDGGSMQGDNSHTCPSSVRVQSPWKKRVTMSQPRGFGARAVGPRASHCGSEPHILRALSGRIGMGKQRDSGRDREDE